MKHAIALAALAGLLAAPLHADSFDNPGATQAGVFVGGRVRVPLGAGSETKKPQAALTVAMSQAYHLPNGRTVTRTGEGIAVDFAGPRPALTLAGVPADVALGLRQQGSVDDGNHNNLSTGAWVSIGAIVAIAGVLVVTQLTCIGKDRDYCGSD